ncbi:MAG: glutamate--tRNA ligase [Clostridiales bacterium]|nr:glutamate--tRNA ligase [Clostridiales bacterium]
MTDYERLAELLFPNTDKTPEYYEELYPPRGLAEGARVTRFAPSPTGFMHMGNMYSAFIDKLNADTTGGIFYLRIEDTDKKREVEGGISKILTDLKTFGIVPDEGMTGENEQKGDYGPYQQSKRKDIYQCFVKELVKKGLAYPCFCSEEEISALREKQEKDGVTPGYYKEYARCRTLSADEQTEKIKSGAPYVIRLRSDGDENKKIFVYDLIKGKIEMPENVQDLVLLKRDGIPTYHFAHAVDDHLMRTTHVVRGDEWIASLPIHIQLFSVLGFKPPKYIHISPLMKMDGESKRKLSKRKDPELAVSFYAEQGYPKESVLEYLLTLANSNFEDWRKTNKTAPQSDFPFNVKKMSPSGAIFDLVKLDDISKNIISVMDAGTVYERICEWAKANDPDFFAVFTENPERSRAMVNIDRESPKPRKDIAKWSEVKQYFSYLFNEYYTPDLTLPENISTADAAAILNAYSEIYDENDSRDEWFEKVKSVCEPLGFTANVKEYKQNPDAFKGHVGDVSTVIRIAVTSRRNTPDLCSIMQLMGKQEALARLHEAAEAYTKR